MGQLDPGGVHWRRSAGAFVDNADGWCSPRVIDGICLMRSLRRVWGRWPERGPPFITGGKEEERQPKRKGNAYTELVYVELCSSHGAFHWAQFNKATWNEPWMGVGKSTRIITGKVGVIESCGRVVCDAGTSSRSAVSMWNIKNLQENFTFLFSTRKLVPVVSLLSLTQRTFERTVQKCSNGGFPLCATLLLVTLLNVSLVKFMTAAPSA